MTPGRRALGIALVSLASLVTAVAPAAAELRGHGGPVRALVISEDDATALSGSFDASAILWGLPRAIAKQVLHFHDGAVNAVALLPDGRAVTASSDARVAVWTPGKAAPDRVLVGHSGPVVAVAVSPDGHTLATASWDWTIRLWDLAADSAITLSGHTQNVNGVAFSPDGSAVISVGYDRTVRVWPQPQPAAPVISELPTPLNAVAATGDGELIAAGADGHVYFLSSAGERLGSTGAASAPVVALAVSRDGGRVAAASADGAVAIIDRAARRVTRVLAVPGGPVWSLAFFSDGRTLLTGSGDRMIRRWDAETGEPLDRSSTAESDPLAAYAADPGARVFRACVACHALSADEGNRAGPSLHRIFGRHIAALPGYNYSDALKRLGIVWTPETLARLFEVGPAAYTPGTKMPDQRIASPEDRAALVKFLERATR